jgi:hypothetical protein
MLANLVMALQMVSPPKRFLFPVLPSISYANSHSHSLLILSNAAYSMNVYAPENINQTVQRTSKSLQPRTRTP